MEQIRFDNLWKLGTSSDLKIQELCKSILLNDDLKEYKYAKYPNKESHLLSNLNVIELLLILMIKNYLHMPTNVYKIPFEGIPANGYFYTSPDQSLQIIADNIQLL